MCKQLCKSFLYIWYNKYFVLKNIFYILFICLSSNAFAQIPAKQENKVGFRSEWFGGINIHSLGWGGTLTKSKFKTYKQANIFTLDIITMKHPKEFKVINQVLEDARGYKFGKLNTFIMSRLGVGRRIMLFEKFRDNGLQMYFTGTLGGNIGMLKPVYLEILNYDVNGNILGVSDEKYDPVIHTQLNIYGKASSFKGTNESTFIFGGHAKAGFTFEFSRNREKIRALETGVTFDFYPEKVPLMAFIQNKNTFVNFYISILFGKKYYE